MTYPASPKVTQERKKYFDKYLPRRPEVGCWLWTGPKSKGYGIMRYKRKKFTKEEAKARGRTSLYQYYTTTAHRFSYLMHVGPIPDGLNVFRTCHNNLCCRPDHLQVAFIGKSFTHLAKSVGYNKGTEHGMAKLSEKEVVDIREMAAETVMSYKTKGGNLRKKPIRVPKWKRKELAEMYDISEALVGFIVTGKIWKHVGGPIQEPNKRSYIWTKDSKDGKKLTWEQALEIKKRKLAGESSHKLGKEFGVTHETVCGIANGKTWKTLPENP